MIELERHIEILLLSNDCVIVPGLGGFMAHHVEASYDESDSTFLPPLRTLGFNPKLTMNDSLLVQSYVEAYDMSYPEALRRIEDEVNELRQHLDNDGCYELNDIGTLALNGDGNMVFTPCEAGILTPALYGLGSFELSPLAAAATREAVATPVAKTVEMTEAAEPEAMQTEQQQTEVAERPVFAAADDDDDDKTVEIKLSWVRNAVAVAAAVVGFLVMTTPVSNSVDGSRSMGQLNSAVLQGMTVTDTNKQAVVIAHSRDTAAVAVTAKGEQADSLNAATAEAAAAEAATAEPAAEEPAAEERDGYTIVLASYITKKNAEAYVEQLHKLGFADAEVFVRKNVTRVVFGHFSSESNAHNKLRTLRDHKEFEEAWVMKN